MNRDLKIALIQFILSIIACICIMILIKSNLENIEQIKQLKQSNIEIQQECEVYRNRCLKLENMLEGTGLVVDNCECK